MEKTSEIKPSGFLSKILMSQPIFIELTHAAYHLQQTELNHFKNQKLPMQNSQF